MMTRKTDNEGAEPKNANAESRFKADSLAVGMSVMIMLTVGQRMIGFVRQLVVCRHLTPEELGRWNLSFSMIILLAPLFVLGLPGTFGRYAEYYRHRGNARSFFQRTLSITALLAIVSGCAILIFARTSAWLIYSDTDQSSLIYLLIPTTVTVIAFNSLVEVMASLRQMKMVACTRFGHAMLFSGLSLALILWRGAATEALIISYAVASLVTCVAIAYPFLRMWRTIDGDQPATNEPSRSLWSKLLPYAGWLWMVDLLSNLYAASDRYMMIHLAGETAEEAAALIGQYHSSRLVPQLFVSVAVLIGSALLPYLSNDWELNERQRVSDRMQTVLKTFAMAATLGGLIVLTFAPWLFGEVLGGKYASGLGVLPMTLVYCSWFGLFSIAQHYLFCAEKGGYLTIAIGSGLALNVLLNFLLVPSMGLTGGVLATVVANGVSLVALLLVCRRFGFRPRVGTLITATLPLCILCPSPIGLGVFLTATWMMHKAGVLVTRQEQAAIWQMTENAVSRIRHAMPWLRQTNRSHS